MLPHLILLDFKQYIQLRKLKVLCYLSQALYKPLIGLAFPLINSTFPHKKSIVVQTYQWFVAEIIG